MAAKKKTTTSRVKIDYLSPPKERPLFYVNNVEISRSTFDIQIRINRIVEHREGGALVENHGTLAMSPQHAASMLKLLASVVRTYEDEIGPIPGMEEIELEQD